MSLYVCLRARVCLGCCITPEGGSEQAEAWLLVNALLFCTCSSLPSPAHPHLVWGFPTSRSWSPEPHHLLPPSGREHTRPALKRAVSKGEPKGHPPTCLCPYLQADPPDTGPHVVGKWPLPAGLVLLTVAKPSFWWMFTSSHTLSKVVIVEENPPGSQGKRQELCPHPGPLGIRDGTDWGALWEQLVRSGIYGAVYQEADGNTVPRFAHCSLGRMLSYQKLTSWGLA